MSSTPAQSLPKPSHSIDHYSEITKGYLFVLTTTILWGIQPFFMKLALLQYTPMSVSWFRLTFAGVLAFLWLSLSRKVPKAGVRALPKAVWLAGIGLALNYYTFLEGVKYGGPSLAAVLIQIGPMLLALVGIFYYREVFTKIQAAGAITALTGFGLFYSDRLSTSSQPDHVPIALAFILFAAATWVLYCIVQKELASAHNAQIINLAVYLSSGLILLPFVTFSNFLLPLTAPSGAVVYLTFSTLIAYGCLAESLKRLPLSQVTIVIICNPFITLIGVRLLETLGMEWAYEGTVSSLGYLGTTVALLGVAITVIWKKRDSKQP